MMNGTSTYGGHNTAYSSVVRPGCDHKGWASGMMCLYKNWSIELLVLLSLIFQIVLAILGSRRKISIAKTIRLVIWASYSLAPYITTLALGKLTSVSLAKSKEEYDTELKALLAPLVLLLLGNPDSITAYSVEDNLLGSRRALNLIITFPLVVYFLVRSWKTSIRMILYFPMFVAGIMEYGVTIWALYSVYVENTNTNFPKVVFDEVKDMTSGLMNFNRDVFDEVQDMFSALTNFGQDVPGLEIFLKAYYRFDCLKPHLTDWLKHPLFISYPGMSIDEYSPEDVFLTTDMELGFMYDALYTKAPVLYTTAGITLRIISHFSLLLTLSGFMGLFFEEKHLRDPYVIYTFGLLIGATFLETYQLLKLFYSDWVIIKYAKHHENPMVLKLLKFLVKRSLKKERWSNRLWQFNFLDMYQSKEQPWFFGILKVCGMAEKFRRYSVSTSLTIPMYFKEILLEDMKKIETKRGHQPFTKRGEWTLNLHECLDKLNWSIKMTFDRSIIIWHIATHVCYHSCQEKSKHKEASKLISDYMMFLLVQHPHILSLTTAEITYHHAYTNLIMFLNKIRKDQCDRENVLKILLEQEDVPESHLQGSFEAVITEGWNVVEEVRTLASELNCTKDAWRLISSVWVEMLCFAAYNCRQSQHAKLVRQGGDLITHVWLLLSHKMGELKTIKYMDRDIEIQQRC